MTSDWQREPDIIEGEYEVVDEWDAAESYYPPQGDYLRINPNPPYVTYVILGINIAAWILMNMTQLFFGWDINEQLLRFGAKVNILVVQGQYWRLFTAMFLHIGVMHLLFNSYALFIYGPVVEKLYGSFKFAIVYVLSGLMGSLFSYIMVPNPAAGASGAIFGLMGSLLYFRQRRREVFQRAFGPGLFIIIGINLFYGFIQPGIDNWGHIGGLVGGFLAGNAIGLYREKGVSFNRILIWILILAMFAGGIWLGTEKYAVGAFLRKAYTSLQNSDFPQARLYAEKAVKADPNNSQARNMMRIVFISIIEDSLKQGDVDGAFEAVETLIMYYPQEAEFLFLRGQIYEIKEDYKMALNDYLRAAIAVEDSAELWFHAGRAAYNTGDIVKAREYLNKSLELDGNLNGARNLLEQIENMI